MRVSYVYIVRGKGWQGRSDGSVPQVPLLPKRGALSPVRRLREIEEMLHNMLAKFRRNEKGATAIEYGLIAALIAVVIIAALSVMGTQLSNSFTSVANSL